ncbi:MAG: VWA domain-containing protein, partial [Planctomycetota bacterium]
GRTSRREAARGAGCGTLSYIYENNPRAVVGIGSYADYFYHVTGPRVIGEHYQAMMDDLQDLGPTGDTAIGRGLRGIQEMIEKCPAQKSSVTVLLLTDGRHNQGEAPEPVAEELREEYGVDIHAIGIGDRSEVDEDRLRRIASCPDQYTFLENWDPDGLLEEFTRVAQIIQTDEEG